MVVEMPAKDALILFYRKNLEFICAGIWSREAQALAKLISLGLFSGGFAWQLFREYKNWGLLHLLVLSGSQFYSFIRALELLLLGTQKLFWGRSYPRGVKIALVPAAVFYLASLGFSAPLVRCALLWAATVFLTPVIRKPLLALALVFVVHIAIIERLDPSDSAFLSWLAFSMLLCANFLFGREIYRNLFVCGVLQLAIFYVRQIPFTLAAFLTALICNLLAMPLYEKYLFPFVGLLSAICLGLTVLWINPLSHWILNGFVAPAGAFVLDLMLIPLLVAHSAFRYTFSE